MRTKEQLIAFERRIADLWEAGQLPFLIHLSGGNEDQLIELFFKRILPGDWILSSHRNHYHYLLAGGTEERLELKIRDGKSMFVFDRYINFMSSAILGGMCGIAAGLALAISMEPLGKRVTKPAVWCFLGDGAADNGHLYEAARFVASRDLPCTFVIEDNDRSCGVTKEQRGADAPWVWPSCVVTYQYTPTYPHAGSGCAKKIEFDPAIVKQHTPI